MNYVISKAVQIITEESLCLFQSHRNPKTDKIENTKVRDQYNHMLQVIDGLKELADIPIPMILHCPICCGRHIDKGEFSTKPHHTHACQHCGHVWRPAIINTVGVQFLPGFKDKE